MLKKIQLLAGSAFRAYKEGGIYTLCRRTNQYLNNYLLFKNYLPPICLKYKGANIRLGFRDKYIYTDSSPKVVPSKSDTVVEAGVCNGKDTAMFGKLSNDVIGFEPSPRNYRNAKKKSF